MRIRITESELHSLVENCVWTVLNEMSPRPMKKQEIFIQQATAKHNGKYDYSDVKYTGVHKNVTIKCPLHGTFEQTPHHHLQGEGCPKCQDSHLERETAMALDELGVDYEQRKSTIGKQHLDFYLPQYAAAIECQGKQHFLPVWGEERLQKQIEWDNKKKEYCRENNIDLREISYKDEKIVSQKVKEIIDSLSLPNQKCRW